MRVVQKEVATSPDSIRRVALEANAADTCIGVIAWMHTFSPAKMWIAGLSALQKPLLHLHTQFNRDLPWAEIDMDFMNLNQSAHGDREFGFLETRHAAAPEDGRRALARPGGRARVWALGARGRAAGTRRSRSGVARFGDNMREVAVTEGDKVEAQIRLGVSVERLRRRRPRRRGARTCRTRRSTRSSASTRRRTSVAPELRAGGDRRESLRDAARIEAGLRAFLDARRLRGLHRHLRGPRTA